MTTTLQTVWQGCYEDFWKGVFAQKESFSHPAKFARGLIRRIYRHLREDYGLRPGAVVVDPFGGIACGAMDAMVHGFQWIGCELEARFFRMSTGHDCPGVTKQQWVRYFHRWQRAPFYGDVCPSCQNGLHYGGNGKIPCRGPHHFLGNLEKWRRYYPQAVAQIVCGDSRRLREVIGETLAECVVESPPFCERIGQFDKGFTAPHDSTGNLRDADYGTTAGQLGVLPTGSVDAILSSPPYAETLRGNGTQTETAAESQAKRRTAGGSLGQSQRTQGYGSKGNLGNLPAGEVDAVIGSPPYAGSGTGANSSSIDRRKQWETYRAGGGGMSFEAFDGYQTRMSAGYGSSDGNLASLPEGSVADAVVSSPPFESSDQRGADHLHGKPVLRVDGSRFGGGASMTGYPTSAGQLGNATGETFWSAALEIVRECHAILRPGGLAAWVVKAFVRKGSIVDFPGDWRRLCESVGFITVEEIHASLVKTDAHPGLFGETVTRTTERKSFFRRLHEKKRPDLAIDHEVVWIMRKST